MLGDEATQTVLCSHFSSSQRCSIGFSSGLSAGLSGLAKSFLYGNFYVHVDIEMLETPPKKDLASYWVGEVWANPT